MLKQALNKSRQLELEDRVDNFLLKKGLPHPRIEPDLVDIETDREKYVSSLRKLLEEQKIGFKDYFIKKQDLPSWVELISSEDNLFILNSIFYNNEHSIIKNSSKKKLEFIYTHELAHLKQFNASDETLKLRGAILPDEQTIQSNSLIEGFAEYVAYQTNKEWFKENRQKDLSILRKNIALVINQEYHKNIFKTVKKSDTPSISGFLIYNILDFKNLNGEILNLMINPLRENLAFENKDELIKAILNNKLFKITPDEFYSPLKYISRIQSKYS